MKEVIAAQGVPGPSTAAVVLAGGRSERFGSDKILARWRGRTLLDHVLDAIPTSWELVVVGPERPASRPVVWAVEDPPDGGPLAGLVAGASAVTADLVVVVAGDMPWAGDHVPRLAEALARAGDAVAAAITRDGEGQANPLLAAYRREALLAAAPRPAHGHRAKLLLGLPHVLVEVAGRAGRDVDRPGDLEG